MPLLTPLGAVQVHSQVVLSSGDGVLLHQPPVVAAGRRRRRYLVQHGGCHSRLWRGLVEIKIISFFRVTPRVSPSRQLDSDSIDTL